MTPIVRLNLPFIIVIFSLLVFPRILGAFDEPEMIISSGNVTGVYYAVGNAVAKIYNRKLKEYKLRLITEASEGSIANLGKVISKKADFGIAQANALYFAQRGEQFWEGHPQIDLRAVLGLYTEALTIIANSDVGVQSLTDLKGKTVNIGEFGSTDNAQARGIFELVGLDPNKEIKIVEKPTYLAPELLQSGDIDAYFYSVGHPNLSVIEASHGKRQIMIVSPGSEVIAKSLKSRPYLSQEIIPIDYYPNLVNKEPVSTIGVKAILFTRKEMDEKVVYHIVKEIYENFDLFERQHPALADLTTEDLTTGLIVPLHPGAERYFREMRLLH